jgi:vacuolar-type H+-ATPase catalytic subunit A/Vma1
LFSQIHVYVKVVIVESETAMEIKRLEKQTIFTFFGALMGSIFGLMGTFGAGMSVVEGFVDRYSKCSV